MLAYMEKSLTKSQRRKVAKYMGQYNNIDAIIKCKQSELFPSKTSTIKTNPVQESNDSPSEADVYLKKSTELDRLRDVKHRMDIAYDTVKPLQKLIWDDHFIYEVRDCDIYYDPDAGVTRTKYYEEKNELMSIVAGCLDIL